MGIQKKYLLRDSSIEFDFSLLILYSEILLIWVAALWNQGFRVEDRQCLSWDHCCYGETSWRKATWGGESFCVLCTLTYSSLPEPRQELNPGIGRILEAGAVAEATEQCCLLLTHDLLNLLSNRIQNHQPRAGTTHNNMGLPTSITNQENALHRLAYRLILQWHFLKWGSLFSGDFSLCQDDVNLASHKQGGDPVLKTVKFRVRPCKFQGWLCHFLIVYLVQVT